MTTRILASWFKFDKYYKLTDDSPVYVAAILLHPSLRQAYLQVQWAQQEQYIGPAIEGVRKMWEEHYKQPCPGTVKLDEKGKNEEATPLELWRKRVYGCGVIEEEFDHFIGQTPIPIPNQTALQWWLDPHRQTVYPALARMAGAIFSIPPMSAGPERVFSGARRTVSWGEGPIGGVDGRNDGVYQELDQNTTREATEFARRSIPGLSSCRLGRGGQWARRYLALIGNAV